MKYFYILFAMSDLDQISIKPKISIPSELEEKLASQVQPESQIIVHCHFFAISPQDKYRIWKSTFLLDQSVRVKSKLVHAENVPFFPQWKMAEKIGWHTFTLVFESLPKSCKVFDLIEEIPEDGAFHVRGIPRNNSDVYHVEL